MKRGTHRARAIKGVLTQTRGDARREHVFVKFGLADDMNDAIDWKGYFGDDKDRGGKTLTERTFDVLHVCGMEGFDLRDLSGITRNEVEIVVVENEFRGEMTLQVRYVQPVGTAAKFMPEAMPDSQANALAERLMRRMKGGPQPSETSDFDDGPPRGDDDIPF